MHGAIQLPLYLISVKSDGPKEPEPSMWSVADLGIVKQTSEGLRGWALGCPMTPSHLHIQLSLLSSKGKNPKFAAFLLTTVSSQLCASGFRLMVLQGHSKEDKYDILLNKGRKGRKRMKLTHRCRNIFSCSLSTVAGARGNLLPGGCCLMPDGVD